MKRSSFLVTGGAGFIGSHLIDALLQQGHQATALSRNASPESPNLKHLADSQRLRTVAGSVADAVLLEAEISRHDFVFHLASPVGVKQILDSPLNSIRNIVDTSETLLETCAKYKRPVLIASTSEVYGKSVQLPFREEDDIVIGAASKRRWSYASAKALVEFIGLGHSFENHLPVYIVRLFNTVGPRQTRMVLPTFVDMALSGRPLTIHGDGEQRRCFCSVYDVVAALMALSESTAGVGQIVNVGSNEEISIRDLARKVVELSGSSSEVVLLPYQDAYGAGFDDVPRSVPDISKIRELVGWQPTIGLEHIIQNLIIDRSTDAR